MFLSPPPPSLAVYLKINEHVLKRELKRKKKSVAAASSTGLGDSTILDEIVCFLPSLVKTDS